MTLNWRSFGFGTIAGIALAAVGVSAFVAARPKVPEDETIIFSDKLFYDSATTPMEDGYVSVTGTISGEHVGYKNNTLTARCIKAESKCVVASAAQIGANQVNEISVDDWDISEWSPSLIVATHDEVCASETLNIGRQSKEIGYVILPTNQAKPFCASSDASIHKWTLKSSLFWQRMGR